MHYRVMYRQADNDGWEIWSTPYELIQARHIAKVLHGEGREVWLIEAEEPYEKIVYPVLEPTPERDD